MFRSFGGCFECAKHLGTILTSLDSTWDSLKKIEKMKFFASAHDCPYFQPYFDSLTHSSVKSLVFNIFLRSFFPLKPRCSFFQKWKRGIKRGITRGYILVRSLDFFLKFSKYHDFSNQNIVSDDPPFSFLKKATCELSLEKKIVKNIKNS